MSSGGEVKTGQIGVPEGLISITECSCRLVSQGLMLGQVLLSIFVNDGTEFTLSVFASDAKVKGEVAGPDGFGTVHRDVD